MFKKVFVAWNRGEERTFKIELDDHTVIRLDGGDFFQALLEGLKACGDVDKQCITGIACIMLETGFQRDE